MSRTELGLHEIQKEMLNTVLKIDEICTHLDIRYSLAYGSLIGAVRHNGFIPWDDDLDIWMSSSDLILFREFCFKYSEEIKPFKLCTRENTLNYSYNIPRFANFDYEYINTDSHQSMFDIGVFVDIYPIEGYGNTEKEAHKIYKKCGKLNELYYIYVNPKSRKNSINTYIKKIISSWLHFIYKDKYYIHQDKLFDKYLSPYKKLECKYVGCVRWASKLVLHKKNEIFDSDGNIEIIKHKFENVELNILKNYDSVLRESYGDYMQLPPEEERHPYHEYKIYKRDDKK